MCALHRYTVSSVSYTHLDVYKRQLLDAVLNDAIIVVIAVGVDPVGDLHPVDVLLSLARTPAFPDVRHDIDDLEGRKMCIRARDTRKKPSKK